MNNDGTKSLRTTGPTDNSPTPRSAFQKAALLRVSPGPALCLLLYAGGHAHGSVPALASLVLSALLFGTLSNNGKTRTFFFISSGAVFLAMGFGLIPGFSPIVLGVLSINSAKAMAGLSAMAALPSPWRWNRSCTLAAASCLLAVPALAWCIGYVRFAPVAATTLVAFVLANVPGTVAEEWFFRKWVHDPLRRFGAKPAVVISALLFGLVHFAGGPAFVALAALAGFGYAAVYQASGSVWAAVVLHLALNAVRVALFGL